MLNSRFGDSVKKNSFKGLIIDYIQNSIIIQITYYSYSYSATILNPNIICIRIQPNIFARILFVFVLAHSEKNEYYSYSYSVKMLMPNIIRIRIWSKKQYSLTSGHHRYFCCGRRCFSHPSKFFDWKEAKLYCLCFPCPCDPCCNW